MCVCVAFFSYFQYLYKENGKHWKQATKNHAISDILCVADPVADALMGNNRKQKSALLLLPMLPMSPIIFWT